MIIEELLLSAGVDFHRFHDEVTITCPFCPERIGSEDRKKRLGINVLKFKAHCFRCDWQADGLREIAKALCTEFGVHYDIMALIKASREAEPYDPEKHEKPPQVTGLPVGYEPFTGCMDFVEKAARDYLKKRGVTAEQVRRHKIGYAAAGKMSWRIIFPVIGLNGKIYGYVGRDMTGTQEPKYLNSPGSKLLWGAHMPAEAAVMSEGVMDALRVEQVLTGAAALADLGSAMTSYQMSQLKRYKIRIYLPDWNSAGIKAAIHIGEKCRQAGVEIRVAVPEILDGRDPGSMDLSELGDWAQTARPYSDSLRSRLRIVKEA